MLFNIAFVLDQDSLSICSWILLVVFRSRWSLLQIEQITRFGDACQFCLLQMKIKLDKTTSVMQMQSCFSSSPPRIIVMELAIGRKKYVYDGSLVSLFKFIHLLPFGE
jgi:hypothetical protein